MHCPVCGNEIPDGSEGCPECGADLRDIKINYRNEPEKKVLLKKDDLQKSDVILGTIKSHILMIIANVKRNLTFAIKRKNNKSLRLAACIIAVLAAIIIIFVGKWAKTPNRFIDLFPDKNFRSKLLDAGVDQNGDGILSKDEAEEITDVNVNYSKYDKGKIENLSGIEYFTELKSLHCAQNDLTSLDLTQNGNLTFLDCGGNQLTSLDITQNRELHTLDCSDNLLTELDLAQNKNLIKLLCADNLLTELDVTQNEDLISLSCRGNQLTYLDLSSCPLLTSQDVETGSDVKVQYAGH